MKHKFKQTRSLSFQDWKIFIEAWLTLSWVDFTVSHLPYRHWKSWCNSPQEDTDNKHADSDYDINRLVWLINAAANNHPRKPTCLRRSITLKKMLERRDINTTLCIGVNKDGSELKAHAWIECNGHVINSDASDITSHYTSLPALNTNLLRKL